MDSQRALAAIVFTDAVGFSGRANINEAEALAEVERDFTIMRESCARHDGQVLKSLGDGLLMVFSSAVQAVLCSIDIQDRLQKGDSDNPLLHRIGIHLGDVILSDSDAKGDGVNIASRLEQEAPPGGICMSGTIYDVVKSRLTVQVRARGETQLKNIVEPIQVYEIGPSAEIVEKLSLRSRNEPERRSMATTYAIFFLGICILGAAGIYFVSNRKPPPEPSPFPFNFSQLNEDGEPSGRILRMTPEGTTSFKGDPKSEEFKQEVEKMTSRILEGLPEQFRDAADSAEKAMAEAKEENTATKPAEASDKELASALATLDASGRQSYDQARKQYAPTYEFEQMLSWVSSQPWLSKSNGVVIQKHWESLVAFKAFIFDAMEKLGDKARDPEDPSITADSIRELLPKMQPDKVQSLAARLWTNLGKKEETTPLLKAFELEYISSSP